MRLARALDLSRDELGLAWLAGILEAEGTFLKPPPSSSSPIVRVGMTDGDVVERVASALGVGVLRVVRDPKHRPVFSASLKGASAVALMRDMRPLLGIRRRTTIDAVLADWERQNVKLSFANAERIRLLHGLGESISALSRRFGVSRSTIRAVVADKIHRSLVRDRGGSPRYLKSPRERACTSRV